jgi:hypothetical protein
MRPAADGDHRRAMMIHALRRLYRRHGIALSTPEYRTLCLRVAGLRPVGVGTTGEPIYCLTVRGRATFAVWSPADHAIVTFLPRLRPDHVRRLMGDQ